MQLKPGAHIHLMGICGTAMASLAGILKDMGYKITGSDQNVYPPMSTQLKDMGITIMEGYKRENLRAKPDLVIVGNVITRNHEEAQELLNSDIPYTSLPKAMGEFVIGKRESIVIAGTHGKTTTTSWAAWMAEGCGKKPGFMIGGIPLNFSKSFMKPMGDWFVIEGDEYDTAFFDKVPKFIHYKPKHVVLTSIEFDHADIYHDLDHVFEAFNSLLKLIPEDGHLIACAEDQNVMKIFNNTSCKNVLTYGFGKGDYQIVEREIISGRNHFCIRKNNEKIADIALKQFGEHNTLNAAAVFALGDSLGWSRHLILQALASFKGVKRRQELLGEFGGVALVEDFAHHPTAVRLTIACMREQFPGRRVLSVFEPRSATSRRKIFQKDFAEALMGADVSFLSQPYDQSRIKEEERFSSEEAIEYLKHKGRTAYLGKDSNALVDLLIEHSRAGDVILVMSNGGFDGIYGKLIAALNSKA